jgi:hypothetical protein
MALSAIAPAVCAPPSHAIAAGPPGDGLGPFLLPIDAPDRGSFAGVRFTPIGAFGEPRVARAAAPAHLHAGLDFARPGKRDRESPVYPIARGEVISVRDDGPFGQIILAHPDAHRARLWSVYEHVGGLRVGLGDTASPERPMARFLDREALERHGRHFDHLHLEILRVAPRPLKPAPRTPFRRFGTYALECAAAEELMEKYQDPRRFLDSAWKAGRP